MVSNCHMWTFWVWDCLQAGTKRTCAVRHGIWTSNKRMIFNQNVLVFKFSDDFYRGLTGPMTSRVFFIVVSTVGQPEKKEQHLGNTRPVFFWHGKLLYQLWPKSYEYLTLFNFHSVGRILKGLFLGSGWYDMWNPLAWKPRPLGWGILLQPPVRQCPFTQKVGEATLSSLVEAIPVQSFQPGEEVEEVWSGWFLCALYWDDFKGQLNETMPTVFFSEI